MELEDLLEVGVSYVAVGIRVPRDGEEVLLASLAAPGALRAAGSGYSKAA